MKNEPLFFGHGFRAENSASPSPSIPELTPYTKMLSKSPIVPNDFTAFQGTFFFLYTIDLQMSPSFMWNIVCSPRLSLMSPIPDLSKEQMEETDRAIDFTSTLEQPILTTNENATTGTSKTDSLRRKLNVTALNFGSIKN